MREEYIINPTEIRNEFSEGQGRPNWILSAWGPKEGPASLLQDNEFSPEEVRLRFYELASQGKADEADREAIELWKKADADTKNLAANADGIANIMKAAEKTKPNRWDYLNFDGTKTREQFDNDFKSQNSGTTTAFGSTANASSPFGSTTSANTFGKPATLTFGQPSQPSVFGSGGSTFGQPSQRTSSFGQPSTFGQASQPASAFGQPSQPTSAFGRASSFGQSSFGQPSQPASTFGRPSQPTSAFGQPSQPTSSFGQPSQPTSSFGQPSQPSSTFGRPSQPTSTFGQPSAFGAATFGQAAQPASNSGQAKPFTSGTFGTGAPTSFASGSFGTGQSTFGQPSQPSSTFGQPSQPTSSFGQPSQPTSSFGQPTQPSSTFGQPSQPTSSFGQPPQPSSTFGQSSQPTSSFGQPSQPTSTFGQQTQTPSPFGNPTPFGQAATSSSQSPFGQSGQQTSAFGQTPASSNSGFVTTSAPSNPFGARQENDQPKDEAMDAGEAQPVSRENPFSQSPAAMPGFGTSAPTASSQNPTQPLQQTAPVAATVSGSGSTTGTKLTGWGNNSFDAHPLTGKPAAKVVYAQTLPPQKAQKGGFGGVSSFRGQSAKEVDGIQCYQRPDGKGFEKIWFPNFAETDDVRLLNNEAKISDTQAPAQDYTTEVTEQFKYFFETGAFKDGKIPLVAPLREWGVYDF